MWITGQVVDASGRALPGVIIEASRPGIPKRRPVVTNAQGHYVLQDLRPGAYTITFAHAGFATLERTIDVMTSYVVTVNASLNSKLAGGSC
jgi:protocatechuate 3,4-dioxygenase beta subunit